MSTTVNQPDEATKELIRSETPKAMAAQGNRSIRDLLESPQFKGAVGSVLPRCVRADRFIRVALNALMRQPDLLNCTKESFFRAMLDLSAYGLEPDGRRAHLIPFNCKVKWTENGKQMERWEKQVQLIVDYKGLVELVRRSGDVSYIHADVVCKGDEFDYKFGSDAFLLHKPDLAGERDPKTAYCAYSFVKLKDGSEDFMILSRSEIERVRARSKSGNNGPWISDWPEMAKKTAFRRHSKWLPLSVEVREAVEYDEEAIDVSGVDLAATMGDGGVEAEPKTGTAALKDKLKAAQQPTQEAPQAAPQTPAPEHTTQSAPAPQAQAVAQPAATQEPAKVADESEEVFSDRPASSNSPSNEGQKQEVRPLKTYGKGNPDLPDPFEVKQGLQAYFIEGDVRKLVEASEDSWKTVSSEPWPAQASTVIAATDPAPGPQAVPPVSRPRGNGPRRNPNAFDGGKS